LRSIARADRLAAVLLALAVVVLFRESLLEGGVFYKRDIHLIWQPQVEGFVRAVVGGALPLWDPSPAFGQPLLADPGAQVLYPPTWLNLVMRPWTYYTLFAFAHVLFSALCFHALARRWGLGPLAALAGAGVWAFSGPFLSLVDLWHHFASAAWIPAVFLAAEPALERRKARDAVRLGLVFAMQILAGSGDVCAMTLAAVVVWAAVVHVDWRKWRAEGRVVGVGTLALAVAGGLSAGLWMSVLEVAGRSARHALPEAIRTYWSVHPLSLVETLVAGVPGRLPLSPEWSAALFEGRGPFLASLYLGLAALGLVGAALATPIGRRRWALVALGLGAGLVALGRHAPVYDLVTALVPPLRVLRYPVKAMVVAGFAWAGLVAFGVESWRSGAQRWRWASLVVCPLALATLFVAAAAFAIGVGRVPWAVLTDAGVPWVIALRPLSRELTRHALLGAAMLLLALLRLRSGTWSSLPLALVAVLAVADLAVAHPRPNPVAPRELYTHRPEVLAALGDPATARVYSYDYSETARARRWLGSGGPHLERAPAGWFPDPALALAQQMSLTPQTAGRWGLRAGFDIDYRGLQAEPLSELTRLVRLVEDRPADVRRLLQTAAVTRVVALHDVAPGQLSPVARFPGLFAEPILVFAVPEPLPRAYAVGGARVREGMHGLMALVDPSFDPRREVVLPEGKDTAPSPTFTGSARIVDERADRVRIEADLNGDGWVVLVDGHDPGWRASVDGHGVPLLRANFAFRAVAVPAGRHVVEMAYRPWTALVGLALSALTLVTALTFLGWPAVPFNPPAAPSFQGGEGQGEANEQGTVDGSGGHPLGGGRSGAGGNGGTGDGRGAGAPGRR
jgi:Bacterial membrane protein YfhO